jgi:hypothetical protein
MMDKFADKSVLFTSSVADYRENDGLPSVIFGLRRNRCRQVAYSHQIVSCSGEGEHPTHPFYASMTSLSRIAHGFDPAKDLLHPLAQALADGLALMAGGPAIDGRGTPRMVLGHMRYGIEGTQGLDKLSGIISFITAHGNTMSAGKVAHYAFCRVPLGGASSRSEAGRNNQAIAVFHQHMPHETEFGLLAFALAE